MPGQIVRYLTWAECEPVWLELVEAATKKLHEQPYSYERFKAARDELDQAFRDKMVELHPGYRVLANVNRTLSGPAISVLLCVE